jgi:stalled ribosome rescue protein Dom34
MRHDALHGACAACTHMVHVRSFFASGTSKLATYCCNMGLCLQEILSNASLVEKIANTTAIAEVKALSDFFHMLSVDSSKAFYGPGHVLSAAEQGAVARLLIADSLYRCAHIYVNSTRVRTFVLFKMFCLHCSCKQQLKLMQRPAHT